MWIAAAVVAAAVVILVLALIGKVYDDRRQADADERAAIRATSAIQSRIASVSIQLEILGDSIEATGADPEAFETASQSLLADSAISGVSYTMFVQAEERRAFEREIGRKVRQIGEDGSLVEAPRGQDLYVIVQTASRDSGFTSGSGVNVGADPVRRAAIDEAGRIGMPVLTAPVPLISSGDPGAVVYAPVANLEDGRIESFAVGIYDLTALTASIAATIPDGTKLHLSDQGETVVAGDVPSDAETREVPVAGRVWDLSVKAPSPEGLPLAFVLPCFGILIVGVVTALMGLARRREQYAHAEAALREQERDFAEEQRRQSEADFSATFEESPIGIALVGIDGRFISVNKSLCELLERSPQELREMDAPTLIPLDEKSQEAARQMLAGEISEFRTELSYLLRGGETVWFSVNAVIIRDRSGAPVHFLCHVEDVSDRHLLHQHLEALADSDELTELLNRRGFGRELQRKLFECERYEPAGALLLFDLDGLKAVNDSVGHAKGDEMLIAAANALRAGTRRSDVVGRIGGDEFAVILPRGGAAEARKAGESLLARLGDERRPGDGAALTASVGIAVFADLAAFTQEAAMNAADLAMYEAKRAGGHGVGVWSS
ncbi:MAG: hypothetical protein QOI31_1418 [Solirubrobacterales bacterium]|nr:hypothetical protein [Solirubrobacterales bacterium]